MADFATSWSSNRPAFADGERWEVIVQHESLRFFTEQPVALLLISSRSESDRGEGLGFTAREQGRSVNAGKR